MNVGGGMLGHNLKTLLKIYFAILICFTFLLAKIHFIVVGCREVAGFARSFAVVSVWSYFILVFFLYF